MTDGYYFTRLRFSGRNGLAKMHGHEVRLTTGPDLGAGPVWSVDYRPEIAFGRIQPRSIDPMRDMTADETRAADALLRKLTEVIL